MAIRDANMNWTQSAENFASSLKPILEKNCQKALKEGLTLEDWYYLVSTGAEDVILDIAISVPK